MKIIETPLGRFKLAGPGNSNFEDQWIFECPGCGRWAYLDIDQWTGKTSVDHAADGCPGQYHETYNYKEILEQCL